ncbi:MAG: extracellular solute-binding protein [Sulfuricellaceae bacterium]|nr:extracellular solute-binding protein [Sulfuricellaceae bacterium]
MKSIDLKLAQRACVPLSFWERARSEGNRHGEAHDFWLRFAKAVLKILFACLLLMETQLAASSTSIALGYQPKYLPSFSHFDYVNPDAPKRGSLILSAVGNFESLNPYLLKGIAAAGINDLVFETLMEQSQDEPFSQYGLLAEDVRLADDRLSVTYRLNPRAKFSDGTPVTARDVKFSFDHLKSEQAHPQFRFMWADIKQAVVLDKLTVRFDFSKINPELHLLTGQIPIFSHQWGGGKPFNKIATDKPIGSGPYRVEDTQFGKRVSYRRNPDYWASSLNVRRGTFNFETVSFIYYKDSTVQLEAFKAGEFDFVAVSNSKQWARDYKGPKFERGLIKKTTLKHRNNAGMQGFVFNTRRDIFKDKRVRRAIALAMDFEWSNRNLFYGQYQRCDSYFSNSELASTGLPKGDELALLTPFKKQLLPEIFTLTWQPPSTTPPSSLRQNLREARDLFAAAGWVYRDGALRNARGETFEFEFLLAEKGFERIVGPFARNLARLGVMVNYRTVDVALYQRRLDTFDFDMTVYSYGQSQSPGNEQMNMWHSSAAGREGSNNVIGIQDPVVDALVEKVVYAPDRRSLLAATHALDRVLLNGEYLIPNWYVANHRVAYWDKLGFPESLPLYYQAAEWVLRYGWSRK